MLEDKLKKIQLKINNNLLELENAVFKKVENQEINAKTFVFEDNDKSQLQSKLIQQQAIIENLGSELNETQKIIRELVKENEFLKNKNKEFGDKIFNLETHGSRLVEAIESDFLKIKDIIKNGND